MTPEQQLADAQQKLHLLQTGRLSVEVVADGYVVKYTRATIPELKAYIRDLQATITGMPIAGAVGIIF